MMRLLNTISSVRPTGPASLELCFGDGARYEFDFLTYASEGGLFSRLADPDCFAQVAIGEGKGYLEWPDGLDFCADALRMDAEAQIAQVPRAS